MNLLQEFKQTMHLHAKGARYLLALSGGMDSVCLLHLCHKASIEVVAAHVNYGLRGEESDGDEAFAKALCAKLGVPIHTTRLPVDKHAVPDGIQAEARRLRYEWFESLRNQLSCDYILTAHHLDDSLETLMMNLSRGAGIRGLRAIPALSGNVFRPLLRVRRSELELFAKAENLTWRDDSSNATDAYLRNRVRHQLLQPFAELRPNALENAGRSMDMLASAHEYLDFAAGSFIREKLMPGKGGDLLLDTDDANFLLRFPALGGYVLKKLGFAPRQLQLLGELMQLQAGRKFTGGGYTAYRTAAGITFAPGSPGELPEVELHGAYGQLQTPYPITWTTCPLPDSFRESGPRTAWLDPEKINMPLLLRPWSPGDRFTPLGMKGTRKVSDFLTDLKVPLNEKNRVLVLESAGEICWVAGYRVSETHRAGTPGATALGITIMNQQSDAHDVNHSDD